MIKIALHGVPRSGTSWLGAIFDSSEYVAYRHQPLFSYAMKSYLNAKSDSAQIDRFFNLLETTNDDFILQKKGKQEGSIPSFKKTNISHIVYKEARYHNILENLLVSHPTIKVIGIVRNPKSVLWSWYNAPKEFNKEKWQLEQEWLYAINKNQKRDEEFYGYIKWREVTEQFLSFKERFPERFTIINYKSLLEDTLKVIDNLFEFCDIPLTKQTVEFVSACKQIDKSDNAYSVFRKNQSDYQWKDNLPKSIVDYIDKDLKGTNLEKFNLL